MLLKSACIFFLCCDTHTNITIMKMKSVCGWLKRIRGNQARPHPGKQPGEAEEAEAIEQIILKLTSLHATLAREPDLRPCCHINHLFEELVSLCTKNIGAASISKASALSFKDYNRQLRYRFLKMSESRMSSHLYAI